MVKKLVMYNSKKTILKRKVIDVINISPMHWFSLKDKSKVPDVSYAFFQTLKLRCGIIPKNKAEVKFIRQVFHDVYINDYKGIYKLDLDKTYASPIDTIIVVKKLEHYKEYVRHTKNVSLKKRLELIRTKNQ